MYWLCVVRRIQRRHRLRTWTLQIKFLMVSGTMLDWQQRYLRLFHLRCHFVWGNLQTVMTLNLSGSSQRHVNLHRRCFDCIKLFNVIFVWWTANYSPLLGVGEISAARHQCVALSWIKILQKVANYCTFHHISKTCQHISSFVFKM